MDVLLRDLPGGMFKRRLPGQSQMYNNNATNRGKLTSGIASVRASHSSRDIGPVNCKRKQAKTNEESLNLLFTH